MDITIYDGIENLDFNKVTEMLSEAIWSKGIKEDEIKQGAVNSALVIGAFCNNVQVGYARVISDKTRFAYIADVYVDENYRHHAAKRTADSQRSRQRRSTDLRQLRRPSTERFSHGREGCQL